MDYGSGGKVKPLRIEARLKNNILYHAIFDMWPSVSEFCRQTGFHKAIVGELINLRKPPLKFRKGKATDKYRDPCLKLAKFFKMLVEDLFPLHLYEIKCTKLSREFDFKALPFVTSQLPMLSAPDAHLTEVELHKNIEVALESLTPREERVLRMRFGIGEDCKDYDEEHTLKEIGASFAVGQERIRQIEATALRKLRHPTRNKALRDFAKD